MGGQNVNAAFNFVKDNVTKKCYAIILIPKINCFYFCLINRTIFMLPKIWYNFCWLYRSQSPSSLKNKTVSEQVKFARKR